MTTTYSQRSRPISVPLPPAEGKEKEKEKRGTRDREYVLYVVVCSRAELYVPNLKYVRIIIAQYGCNAMPAHRPEAMMDIPVSSISSLCFWLSVLSSFVISIPGLHL